MNTSIRAKLIFAFGTILVILSVSTALNFFFLSKISDIQHRVINLRVNTVDAGKDITNAINASLAALRGYIILGNDPAKAKIMRDKRTQAWSSIGLSLKEIDILSSGWTVPKNIEVYQDLKKVLIDFKVAQQEIESIAQAPQNIPSYQLLLTEAAPKASIIMSSLTNIINLESSLSATTERKILLKLLADSRGSFAIGLANIRAFLLSGDVMFKEKFLDQWQVNQQRLETIVNNYQYLFTVEQLKLWDQYVDVRLAFSNLPNEMFNLRNAADWNKANYFLGTKAAPKAVESFRLLNALSESQEALLAADVSLLEEQSNMQYFVLIAGGALSLLMSLFMASWISKDLLGRLNPILQKSQDIANNNLTTPVLRVVGNDELAKLTQSVNAMSSSLSDTLHSTAESMRGVSNDANNIYHANSDMSSSISQQVEQISLIASAIEELSASASEVSNYSSEAASSADESLRIAQQGGILVDDSLSQMNEISDAFNESATSIESLSLQSKQIEDILGVIRGIAEQTNLLALNAAIEAARAGEQGRGFAVVADEVRQLASRTTDATTDVEKAIESMRNDTNVAVKSMGVGRDKVSEGIVISNKVADALVQIIDCAKDVAVKVDTIAATSKQQSVVTEEIAGNTDQASTVSLQVSEGIEKVVAMAQAVTANSTKRADELNLMINR